MEPSGTGKSILWWQVATVWVLQAEKSKGVSYWVGGRRGRDSFSEIIDHCAVICTMRVILCTKNNDDDSEFGIRNRQMSEKKETANAGVWSLAHCWSFGTT